MAKREQSFVGDAEVFGPYLVYERIGVGGMATVHRAKERGIEGFERIVALKRLLPHLAEDEKFVRAFVREAKLASLLQHPNIIQLYELGRVGHVYFISMELIEGRDVRQILRRARRLQGPPPIPVVLSLLCQVCDALDYAHTRTDEEGEPLGLVHRDVSPSNLIVSESGYVKIIDFGIAKATSVHLRTQSGRVKGKMAYMSPEAIKGLTLDARSDMFSTGVLAHELLTARPLFATKNDYQTLMRVQKAAVAPPSTYNQSCPPELDAIVLKALDRDRGQRWQSAEAMRDALDELRATYRLSAGPAEVAEWIEAAFSREPPRMQSHPGLRDVGACTPVRVPSTPPLAGSFESKSAGSITPPTGPLRIPIGGVALPVAEEDEEIIEIAWGGRSSDDAVPVLLDEVPDVSDKYEAAALEPETPPPQEGHGGSTLVTHVPPPPEPRAPTAPPVWASGTVSRRIFLDHDTQEELLLDGPPTPTPTLERLTRGRPGTIKRGPEAGPVVNFHKPKARPRAVTEIGSAIVERVHRRRRTWLQIKSRGLAIATVVTLTAGGAAWLLVRMIDSDTGAAARASATATLTFALEPGDAVVAIEGHGDHFGSPMRISLEPGEYRVEVKREGYTSWVSSLRVTENENQTVRVALDRGGSGTASVTVRSTRPGMTILVDGKPVQPGTPTTFDVAPGPHAIEIAEDGRSLWRHEFTAGADTRYEFHPALVDKGRRRASRQRGRRHRRSKAPLIESPEIAQTHKESPASRAPTPGKAFAPLPIAGGEPPEAPAPSARARRARGAPVVVLANAVRRVSGKAPVIPRHRRASSPARMSAKLCIDRRGRVSSANLLASVPGDVERAVEKSLRKWRYRPHREDGERVPACFAIQFAIR